MTDTDAIRAVLENVYEEIMWLARRPNTTASVARSWYTHCKAVTLARRLRVFSGLVSRKSLEADDDLRLEHYMRIQTVLTKLVSRHVQDELNDATEFVDCVIDCEKVHIVTVRENYDAMKSKGDYPLAGIEMLRWEDLALATQEKLWKRMLKGRVSNAQEFAALPK